MTKTTQKRRFCGMAYRDVQRSNRHRRSKLPTALQQELKKQGFCNVGWNQVILLFQQLNAVEEDLDDSRETLEDLFLQADRIGNKYQTSEEIQSHWSAMAEEVQAISNLINQQFPDTEVEHYNYSQGENKKNLVSANR